MFQAQFAVRTIKLFAYNISNLSRGVDRDSEYERVSDMWSIARTQFAIHIRPLAECMMCDVSVIYSPRRDKVFVCARTTRTDNMYIHLWPHTFCS